MITRIFTKQRRFYETSYRQVWDNLDSATDNLLEALSNASMPLSMIQEIHRVELINYIDNLRGFILDMRQYYGDGQCEEGENMYE